MIEFHLDGMAMHSRIKSLADERGIALTPLAQKLGLSTSSFTEWKKGKAMPSLSALAVVADYFDVTLDYLVFGTKEEPAPEPFPDIFTAKGIQEQNFLMKFRTLSPILQDKALAYMEGMLSASVPEQTSEKRYLA